MAVVARVRAKFEEISIAQTKWLRDFYASGYVAPFPNSNCVGSCDPNELVRFTLSSFDALCLQTHTAAQFKNILSIHVYDQPCQKNFTKIVSLTLGHKALHDILTTYVVRVAEQMGVVKEPLLVTGLPFYSHVIRQAQYLDSGIGISVLVQQYMPGFSETITARLLSLMENVQVEASTLNAQGLCRINVLFLE